MRKGAVLGFVGLASIASAALVAGCSFATSLSGISDDYGKPDPNADGGALPRDGKGDGAPRPDGGGVADADSGAAGEAGGPTAQVLASGQRAPLGITVTDAEIFWITVDDTSFWRMLKTGGTPTKIAVNETVAPFDVAIEGSFLYWTDQANTYRQQVNTTTRQYLNTGDARAAFLTVLGASVYFTDYRGDRPGSVQRNNATLFAAQGLTSGIANVGNTLIWAHGPAGSFSVIDAADISPEAGTPTASTLFSTGTFVQGLAADTGAVYWMEAGKRIMRGDRATKKVTTLFEGATVFDEGDVAVDATHVYWSERGTGTLRRMPIPR